MRGLGVAGRLLRLGVIIILGSCAPGAPRAPTSASAWTYHASAAANDPCPGAQLTCEAWLAFRRNHPTPRQTTAVRIMGEQAVVIISEPPPTLSAADFDQLVADVFGADVQETHRFRWGVGVDGWLEDAVLRVSLTDRAVAPARSGEDMSTWSAPALLQDRLRFLHRTLYGAADGFTLDPIDEGAPTHARVPLLAFTQAELDVWLRQSTSWIALADGASIDGGMTQIVSQAGAYASGDGALIAFVVPPDSALAELAGPFRQFAAASDLLITALRVHGDTFVLIGRARQAPFSLLPPLRFETFKLFVENRSAALAQSYERQRIFAGRLSDGGFADWDWAPIYLSAQLEDTEFGVLLNVADQKLKAWSERGLVQYYDFNDATPAEFPFAAPASALFAERLQSQALTYNWNTEGYSALGVVGADEALVPSRITALPMIYLPATMQGDMALEGETAAFVTQRTDEARAYFAAQGDPTLTRVAQYVLLYQAVENLFPAPSAAPPQRPTRVSAVLGALEEQTLTWLQRITSEEHAPTDAVAAEAQRAVRDLLRLPGMTIRRAAEWLAHPQTMTDAVLGRAVEVDSNVERRRIELNQAIDAYNRARDPRVAEAARREVDVRRAAYQRAATQGGRAEQAFERLLTEEAAVMRLAPAISLAAEQENQQDRTLSRVLEAAAGIETIGAIRTPSVVLSRHTANMFLIGGHNIGGLLPAAARPAPAVRPVRSVEQGLGLAPNRPAIAQAASRRRLTGAQTQAIALDAAPIPRDMHFVHSLDGNSFAVAPRGGELRVVEGIDGVYQSLFGTRQQAPILFEGFSRANADAISQSLTLAWRGETRIAPTLFSGGRGGARGTVISGPSQFGPGRNASIFFYADAALARRISALQPNWALARYVEPPATPSWLAESGISLQPNTQPVIGTIEFSGSGAPLRNLHTLVHAQRGQAARYRTLVRRFAEQEIVRARAERPPLAESLLHLREQLTRDMNGLEVEFWLQHSAGDMRVGEIENPDVSRG